MERHNTISQFRFIWRWSIDTLLGWVLGQWFAGSLAYLIFASVNTLPILAVRRPPILAACTALLVTLFAFTAWVQWKPNLESVFGAKPRWPAAGAVSGVLMGVILAMIAYIFTNSDGLTSIPQENTLTFRLGVVALVGLAIGLPQWIVLRGYVHRASLWVAVNVLAALVAISLWALLTMLIFYEHIVLVIFGYFMGIPLMFGAITGTALFRLLQDPKQTSD